MIVGAGIGVAAGLALTISYFPFDPIRTPVDWIRAIFVAAALPLFLGPFYFGGWGLVIGSFFVEGVHRRNVLLGAVFAALLGVGLSIMISQGPSVPPRWVVHAGVIGCFTWLGAIFGLLSRGKPAPSQPDEPSGGAPLSSEYDPRRIDDA
jgi:hypothetical protein